MEATKTKHEITQKEKEQFSKLLILERMINARVYFDIMMEDGFKVIEPLFIEMNADGYIRVEKGQYVPTEKGRNTLNKFMQRYFEYNKIYEIFAHVDLGAGEFGMKEAMDISDDDYDEFMADERWDDVRIAVAEFKKMNVIEIVFMNFLDSGEFDLEKEGWQFDIVADLVWDKMVHVANNSITIAEICAEHDNAMEELVKAGQSTVIELNKIFDAEDAEDEEEEFEDEEEEVTYVEVIVEEHHTQDYWDCYYDPFYCSPLFYDPYWY